MLLARGSAGGKILGGWSEIDLGDLGGVLETLLLFLGLFGDLVWEMLALLEGLSVIVILSVLGIFELVEFWVDTLEFV